MTESSPGLLNTGHFSTSRAKGQEERGRLSKSLGDSGKKAVGERASNPCPKRHLIDGRWNGAFASKICRLSGTPPRPYYVDPVGTPLAPTCSHPVTLSLLGFWPLSQSQSRIFSGAWGEAPLFILPFLWVRSPQRETRSVAQDFRVLSPPHPHHLQPHTPV